MSVCARHTLVGHSRGGPESISHRRVLCRLGLILISVRCCANHSEPLPTQRLTIEAASSLLG